LYSPVAKGTALQLGYEEAEKIKHLRLLSDRAAQADASQVRSSKHHAQGQEERFHSKVLQRKGTLLKPKRRILLKKKLIRLRTSLY
jgi:hypothetical protein